MFDQVRVDDSRRLQELQRLSASVFMTKVPVRAFTSTACVSMMCAEMIPDGLQWSMKSWIPTSSTMFGQVGRNEQIPPPIGVPSPRSLYSPVRPVVEFPCQMPQSMNSTLKLMIRWRIRLWALSAFAGRAYVAAMSLSGGVYRPPEAEHAVLYRVIDEHLDAFLETARRHADGVRLPAFVEQEFRDFLTCGVLAHGFARLRCTDCALERLVPFSCKGRGFYPSCGGLVDDCGGGHG
jgi:hypothetical protein